MRPLALLEVVALLSLGGSLLAVAVPAFVMNLRASRLAEPIDGLASIAGRATLLASGAEVPLAYPASVAMTPSRVPAGQRVADPTGSWDHPTWRRLDFSITDTHSFAFSFDSTLSATESRFVARAQGDLDGDGVLSSFTLGGSVRAGEEPRLGHLEVYREV